MRGRGNKPINPNLSYPRDLEDQFSLFFCIPVMLGFSFNLHLRFKRDSGIVELMLAGSLRAIAVWWLEIIMMLSNLPSVVIR